MAPPPGIVEVRCAGCGETLEVEPGLTEFACPDCGTHQALPPELLPRRPRRALPLPGRCAPLPTAPSRVTCWGCGAVLSAPHGQGRFACPLCGSELAASQTAAVSVVAPPAAVPITPSRLAQPSEPASPSSHREESHTEPLDEIISRPSKKKSRFVAGPNYYAARKLHEEHPNQAVYASEAQGMPSNSSVQTDKVEDRFPNGTVTVDSKQKIGNVVVPSTIEQEWTKSLNQAVDEQQAGEIPNNIVHANKVQVNFASKAGNCIKSAKGSKVNQKRKSKILSNFSNELPQLRRSKCLVNGSHNLVDIDPIEKIDPSPNQNLSEDPEIERNLTDSDPCSPARYRFPHGGSNEWDRVDATTPPALSHGTPQADQFPRTQMCSPETRWALPVACSNSWHDHEIPQESSNGVGHLERGYAEVCSNPAEMQNQDMDGHLAQEACSDKNRLGQLRLKPHNENLSEHGRPKRNGFTGSSSNGGVHLEDQSVSGTCHQNLSASCSRLAALLPIPAATALPMITSPSSHLPLNCSSPTLLHQQPPSPLYSQDAPCGDVLPKPISNSSKKRRGRAPEKLMEPRKEADRPVLTPSGADWNVHPPCPKVANTLSLLIKQNYPGIYVSDDTSGNGQSCEHVVYHWHQCPPDTVATILDEFLKRYKWSPGHEEECQKLFDRKAVRQLVNLFCYEKQRVRQVLAAKKAKKSSLVCRAHGEMELEEDGDREDSDGQQGDESVVLLEHEDPLKWKPFFPAWMKPKWWEMLCDHWAKDEIMKVSYQQRKNRYSGKRPCDAAGSQKLGSHSVLRQVGSGKRGRYCGAIGISKKSQHKSLSKLPPVCVSKQEQQPMFTKEQVQEMINQALQGLNEAWEKKFLSLEQKMPRMMSSSHIVPNGVKESSLAVGRSKQCKLARQ
uniref:Uncharacterized protein n=1 Tax=Setaria italica TaxID=4555 RepID=K3YDS4_SETIT